MKAPKKRIAPLARQRVILLEEKRQIMTKMMDIVKHRNNLIRKFKKTRNRGIIEELSILSSEFNYLSNLLGVSYKTRR